MNGAGGIGSILIVGGGTAGWMAAVRLNRFLRATGCKVALVESPAIETIGVGEATVPPLVKFVSAMKLDEAEFMRRCGATYKLGIKFLDWIRPGHALWHPFGLCGGLIDGIDLFHFWLRLKKAGRPVGPYAAYSLQAQLADAGKAPRPFDGASPVTRTGSYAYHVDAHGLATYFKDIATAEGVSHVFDTVRDVVVGDGRAVTAIRTTGGRTLTADLLIDCTGFASRLVEEALGDPWVDWSDQLFCDRAVVLPLPIDESMPPFTRATALDAGWMWQIPLSYRLGCGYVFSSRHSSEDEAARQLIQRSGLRRARGADPRVLRMRIGRRKNFWLGNCVAVGLASGFVEPLESTGLYFIQRSIEILLEYFPDAGVTPALRRAYNRRMADTYDEVRDFIVLHYLLNRRDEAFWRDARHVAVSDALGAALELYDEFGKIEAGRVSLFQEPSHHFILSGGEREPRRPLIDATLSDPDRTADVLERIRGQNGRLVASLPTHRDLIRHIHRTDAGRDPKAG